MLTVALGFMFGNFLKSLLESHCNEPFAMSGITTEQKQHTATVYQAEVTDLALPA